MCGIVYYNNLMGKPVNYKVIERYRQQRSRGTSGFGFYLPETDRLVHNPRENRILRLLGRERQASEILMHHRYPTSTSNVRNACHPFSTRANQSKFKHQYVLVHNGVLSNDDDLHKAHTELGIKYVSEQKNGRFNDSESLLYDVALFLEGKQELIRARGSIAFVVIEKDEKGVPLNVHFGRNYGNPLKIKRKTNKFLYLASEGKGKDIDPHNLYTFNYETQQLTKRHVQIMPPIYNTTSTYNMTKPVVSKGWTEAQRDYEVHGGDDGNYYDTVLTKPLLHSPSMSGCYYANGYYDMAGNWTYYQDAVEDKTPLSWDRSLVPSKNPIGFQNFSREPEMPALARDYLAYILKLSGYDRVDAVKLLHASMASKMLEHGELDDDLTNNKLTRSDTEAFNRGIENLNILEDEVKVIQDTFKLLNSTSDAELVNQFLVEEAV